MISAVETKRSTSHASRGFTLTEVVVVIAVMGILACIAAPMMVSWRSSLCASQSAKNILDTLRVARSKAMSTTFQREVVFDIPNGRYQVLATSTHQSYNTTAWAVEEDWVQLPKGLLFRSGINSDSLATVIVQFNANGSVCLETPSGTTAVTPVYITVQGGGQSMHKLCVAPIGRFTLD